MKRLESKARPGVESRPMKNETKNQRLLDAAERLVRSLTSLFLMHPGELTLRVGCDRETLAVAVTPHFEDYGAMVGQRSGGQSHRMLEAFHVLLNQLARKHGLRHCVYTVTESGGCHAGGMYRHFEPDPEWPALAIRAALREALDALFERPTHVEFKEYDVEGKTRVYIELSQVEPKHFADVELRDAFSVAFNAIGRANGRLVFVERLEGAR